MYACPQCKGPLVQFNCERCGVHYPLVEGIPCFLMGSAGDSGQIIRQIYDDIYRHHENVWVDQGRSEQFMAYFSNLARSLSSENVLEIGCGEGILLASLSGVHKFGIDPSVQALIRAKQRSGAECAVARAEALPFPSEMFDLIVSVGVMEHFENPEAATAEIRRVLTKSGHYLVLFHTDMGWRDRLVLKVKEFLFPRFRPKALARWITKKARHPIVQPLRKSYTQTSARELLERHGLIVTQVISRETQPAAPLAGRHVITFIAKQAAS